MKTEELIDQLGRHQACSPALLWMHKNRKKTPAQLWKLCKEGEWMLWFLAQCRLKLKKKDMYALLLDIVKTTLAEVWGMKKSHAVLDYLKDLSNGKREVVGKPEELREVIFEERTRPEIDSGSHQDMMFHLLRNITYGVHEVHPRTYPALFGGRADRSRRHGRAPLEDPAEGHQVPEEDR